MVSTASPAELDLQKCGVNRVLRTWESRLTLNLSLGSSTVALTNCEVSLESAHLRPVVGR